MTDLFTSTPVPVHPSARRLIALGTIRCPVCDHTFEDCTCTGIAAALATLTAQTFDDGSDFCPLCGYWTCRCGTPQTTRTLAVTR